MGRSCLRHTVNKNIYTTVDNMAVSREELVVNQITHANRAHKSAKVCMISIYIYSLPYSFSRCLEHYSFSHVDKNWFPSEDDEYMLNEAVREAPQEQGLD